jgi:phage protein D
VSPPVDTGVLLALATVKFNGVDVREELIQEVRVQDSLSLPAAFSVTFVPNDLMRGSDPLSVEGTTTKIGTEVQIFLGGAGERQPTKLLEGEITALEPNFAPDGIRLVVAGYDRSHRLHRARKTRTFQKMSTSQIVTKLAGEAGLAVKAGSTNATHEFVQQNNETDWEFLHRLASMVEYEVVMDGKTLLFRRIVSDGPPPLELEYGAAHEQGTAVFLHSFYPRATAAQGVKEVFVRGWDPVAKKEITAKAPVKQGGSEIGITRDSAISTFGAASITVADAPVSTIEDANQLALSLASYVGHAFVGAYGTCDGNPRVRAGTTLKIKGLGREFSGTYRCSATTHVFGGGYSTSFEVLGRSPRDLLDLARPATRNSWGDSLVVGIVTNNRDEEKKMGRVRVKYPGLDGDAEGAWARVLGVGAGKERGQMMLPQVNDEVLIGFEGGNPHKPYVLGALWNGQDKPIPPLLNPKEPSSPPDGSYVLRSPKLIDMESKDDTKMVSKKDLIVEVEGEGKKTVKKSFVLDAATELTLVCGQAKLVLKKDGTIQLSGMNITVAGNGNLTVEGKTGAAVKGAKVDVQGTGPVTIKGAQVAIN